MEFHEYMEATKGKGVNDLVEEIKKIPSYSVYENAIKRGDCCTDKLLACFVMMESLTNLELSALVDKVSLDMLFAIMDNKLKEDILGEHQNEPEKESEQT